MKAAGVAHMGTQTGALTLMCTHTHTPGLGEPPHHPIAGSAPASPSPHPPQECSRLPPAQALSLLPRGQHQALGELGPRL